MSIKKVLAFLLVSAIVINTQFYAFPATVEESGGCAHLARPADTKKLWHATMNAMKAVVGYPRRQF